MSESAAEDPGDSSSNTIARSSNSGSGPLPPQKQKTTRLPALDTRLCVEGKVVVVGDMSVGKTCVVSRFTKDGTFDSVIALST
jgi:hypothetical protein